MGRFDEALALWQAVVEQRSDFFSLGALAVFHAERGEAESAEGCFDRSLSVYGGVSPIPLALLEFQRGHMWMSYDPERARTAFHEATRLLPAYAPAQGHLAEVEATLGDVDAAIGRLTPLAASADDPDYAAALARVLRQAGRPEPAACWRLRAAARYDELVARHPDAFADHLATFLLEDGGEPRRALALAERNATVRRTPRALRLVERARAAVEADVQKREMTPRNPS